MVPRVTVVMPVVSDGVLVDIRDAHIRDNDLHVLVRQFEILDAPVVGTAGRARELSRLWSLGPSGFLHHNTSLPVRRCIPRRLHDWCSPVLTLTFSIPCPAVTATH